MQQQICKIPRVMGILNITPDSFSDGGRFDDVERATRHALNLLEDGADILDIGAESSRPGAQPITEKKEIQKLVPVIRAIKKQSPQTSISVDTYKPNVMKAVLDEGVDIINNIYGFSYQFNQTVSLVKEYNTTAIVMHMRGSPDTMQENINEDEDVLTVSEAFLRAQVNKMIGLGVAKEKIWVDPGIGFGKTIAQNFRLIKHGHRFADLSPLGYFPVVMGVSRKSFIGQTLEISTPSDRDTCSKAIELLLAQWGTAVIRTHNVHALKEILKVYELINHA